jgi:hypothetical protein
MSVFTDKTRILFNYTIFSIAMAYLESAVVVYLRLIYYPNGFNFPMVTIPLPIALTEIGREVATIVMLWFLARLAARNRKELIAMFLYNFAVWDIFYYVWLKVLLDWPAGWTDWDILFLIPLPWIAPWLAPALISAGLISGAVLVWRQPGKFGDWIFSLKEWLVELTAAGLIMWSFFYETGNVIRGGVPERYPWILFITGYAIAVIPLIGRLIKKDKPA